MRERLCVLCEMPEGAHIPNADRFEDISPYACPIFESGDDAED